MNRLVWQIDEHGRPVRLVAKPVIVTEEPPKWGRLVLPLAFVVFCLVAVLLNAAQYEVSEDVPYAVSVEGR